MGLFGKSKRELELERQNAMLRSMLADSANKSSSKKPAAPKKTKYVTRQCKYCGYRVTHLAAGIVPGTTCPKRKSGQPHIWQILGYEYK